MTNITERQRAELNVMIDEVNKVVNLTYGTDDFDLHNRTLEDATEFNGGGNAYGRSSYGRSLYYYLVDSFMHSIGDKAKSTVATSILKYERTAYYAWENKHRKMVSQKDQTYLDMLEMMKSMSSRIRVEGWTRNRMHCVKYIDEQIAKLEDRKKGYLKSVEVQQRQEV